MLVEPVWLFYGKGVACKSVTRRAKKMLYIAALQLYTRERERTKKMAV